MYILVQVAAEAARVERRAHWHLKAVKKQAGSKNDQPPSNFVSSET